ncbi:hypothetical protein SFRURICE_016630 [Spodoptera frugiperda]|nr:hypothetical protein SFRURICE_016630 [Spodoptera frugiperda]
MFPKMTNYNNNVTTQLFKFRSRKLSPHVDRRGIFQFGVRCQKTSPWCTLGTGNSPPNGGDRVGEAIACSELLDGAEEPEMESPSGSGARGEALVSSGKSHTRVPSREGSDSESDSSSVSGVSVISMRQTRSTFKRPRTEEVRGLSSSSNTQEAPAPPKIPTTARGRGRGRPKRLSATARSKPAKRLAAEDTLRSGALSDSSIKEVSDADGMEGERGTGTLRQTIKEALRQVAGKTTKAAQLKSVEAEIMAAVFDVCRVPSAGKVHKELAEMRQELARLSASNAALETELRSTKAELAACRGSHPQPSAEPDMLGLMRREMAAFQQRFNVLEGRLLRPSLAASSLATSRSYAAVAARSSTSSGQTGCGAQQVARPRAAPPTRTPAPPAVQAQATAGGERVFRTQKKEKGCCGAPTPTARGPDGSEWQVVGEARRVAKEARKRRKKAQRQRRQQERKEKRAAALLLAPKTAAVVITLQPDAVKRGMTYGDVLAKLKGAVTPAEFGAPDGFAMKVTATGARLLEVPGATSGPTADALAERIRACLGADEARVSRPTKCLDLRILGLDGGGGKNFFFSVTEHEVVAAVARTGGCPVDQNCFRIKHAPFIIPYYKF